MQRLLRTSGLAGVGQRLAAAGSSLAITQPLRFTATAEAAAPSPAAEASPSATEAAAKKTPKVNLPRKYAFETIKHGLKFVTKGSDKGHHVRVPKQPQEAYTKIGNIFIIKCTDYPFKYSWEVCRMLRDLRLEFRGQVVIFPDIPAVRLRLWRCRHVVSVDMMSTVELKKKLGVPSHITFRDLARQLPSHMGDANRGAGDAYLRSRVDFMAYRRERLRDIMHRDQQELKLLSERKKLQQVYANAAMARRRHNKKRAAAAPAAGGAAKVQTIV